MDTGERKEDIKFEHFDVVVPEAGDHYYLNYKNSDKAKKCFNDNNAPLYSTIMKEWKILKENLPDSIYVQVYETRIDLLRAVIVGAPGTPYHDGLFFFDILLPTDYPKNPPQVYYHSHGHRLNPNLYSNGYVCLSLINTWSGSKVEKWTKKSTILQILVSIQGLVLNERPYFNEPGYEIGKDDASPKWVNGSIEYNENAFVLSCLTMLRIMAKPPMGFEGFVARHFRERVGPIVAAIEAYQVGRVLVGQYGVVESVGEETSSFNASPLFKESMAKIHAEFGKIVSGETIIEAKMETPVEVKKVEAGQENVDKGKIETETPVEVKKVETGQENVDKGKIVSDETIGESKTKTQLEAKKASATSNGSESGKIVQTGQENVGKQSKGLWERITGFLKVFCACE